MQGEMLLKDKHYWKWKFVKQITVQVPCQISWVKEFKISREIKNQRELWNTVVGKRVRYFLLLNNSYKSWSIIKTSGSFGICTSWGFQNCPWKLDLTKIWLRISRTKTKSNLKHFFDIDLLFCTSIFSAKSWSNLTFRDSFGILRTCRFQNCPWFW